MSGGYKFAQLINSVASGKEGKEIGALCGSGKKLTDKNIQVHFQTFIFKHVAV